MIIRDPDKLSALLGKWERYVNFVDFLEEGQARHYGLDLAGNIPGLDWSRLNPAQISQGEGPFYWVHIAPGDVPATAAVTLYATWRCGGEIANYEHPLPKADRFQGIPAVTFAEPARCDPPIIQEALALALADLDREVGSELSRGPEFERPL